jgi:hypothetical protein
MMSLHLDSRLRVYFVEKPCFRAWARPCSDMQSTRSVLFPIALLLGIAQRCVSSGRCRHFLLLWHQPLRHPPQILRSCSQQEFVMGT